MKMSMLTLLILSGGSDEADIILGPRFSRVTVSELDKVNEFQS